MTMKILSTLALTTTTMLTLGLTSTTAHAEFLDACGGVYFEALAEGSCELVPVEQCETACEPVAVTKVCASRLYTECDSSCTATATVECEASCSETCVPSCETEAATQPPNCMGLAMSDCQMDCNAKCEGEPEHGECRSACAHTCAHDCDAQCEPEQETTCEPVCATACSGSCEARANIDCQVDCQNTTFTECETTVTEECRQDCETTGAAIFCEGQFMAAAGNLEACAADLEAAFDFELDVNVDIDVDVDAECMDGMCEGEGEIDSKADAGIGCTVNADRPGGFGWAVFSLFGIGAWRIRRAHRS
jgi:hypothetical protein